MIIHSKSGKQYDIFPTRNTGEEAMKCPACSAERKKKNVKCFNWNHEKSVGHCGHCGESFYVKTETEKKKYVAPPPRLQKVSDKVVQWFEGRGISNHTLLRFKITEAKEFMPQTEKEMNCICFNYFDNEELVNIKFRSGAKHFKMVKDAKLIFYNLDAIKDEKECVICEGEIDCLSFYESGIYNCVSVPNGATRGNQKLEYLDNCIEYFLDKEKIIIATDGDEAGLALREELSRRLGKERCWLVKYPENTKDANDVLRYAGKEGVKKLLEEAYQYPVEGIETISDLDDELMDLYYNGYPQGKTVGYQDLDKHITFRQGELTIVTGTPGAGKSTWLNSVLVKLANRHDWRIAYFSPEKQPSPILIAELIEIFSGQRFHAFDKRLQIKGTDLMLSKKFLADNFWFMKIDEIDVTIDGILEKSRELVVRYGLNCVVIDPWNYVEHKLGAGQSETHYVSEVLTKIKRFKDRYGVHIFLVAHPTKMKTGSDGKFIKPTLYDISGSANFFNKTDNGLVLYRDYVNEETIVYVDKIRWSFVGKVGSVHFKYNPINKRFYENDTSESDELGYYKSKHNGEEVELFAMPDETPRRLVEEKPDEDLEEPPF